MFVDSHCHLTFQDFPPQERKIVLQRAESQGIHKFLTVCTELHEILNLKNFVREHPNVFMSIGVHPHHSFEEYGSSQELKKILFDEIQKNNSLPLKKIIALGETGLDYFYQPCNKQQQIENFITHIEVAQTTNYPLIIHTREAQEDTLSILRSCFKKSAFKGILHCFTGSLEFAQTCIQEFNFLISFSGILTFKNAVNLQAVAKNISLENILIETDSPYLAPIPYRGQRNEPVFLIETAKKLAAIKDTSLGEVARQTTFNFDNFFNQNQ